MTRRWLTRLAVFVVVVAVAGLALRQGWFRPAAGAPAVLAIVDFQPTSPGGDLNLRTNMTILGNSIQATILSGNNSDRVLHIQNGADVLIQNVQITGA